jgi:hypothetical protein
VRNADAIEVTGRTCDDASAQIVNEPVVDRLAVEPPVPTQAPVLRFRLDVKKDDLDRTTAGV